MKKQTSKLQGAMPVGSAVLLGGKSITVRIRLDDGGMQRIAKEITLLLKSLSDFRNDVRLCLLDKRSHQLAARGGRAALRAGDNVISLRVSRSLEVCVAALRTLNLYGAHKILKRGLPPNVES
jgi:hypothetical protein